MTTVAASQKKLKLYPRFSKYQRWSHWTFVLAFFTALITGLILYIPWTSTWAVGGWTKLLHRIAAVVLMIVPLYYFFADERGFKEMIVYALHWDKDDVKWLRYFIVYVLGRAHHLPPQGAFNAGEKIHHLTIAITYNLLVFSGLVMWFGASWLHQAPYHDLFLAMILLHDLSMILITIVTFGHIYFSFEYGALPGMVDGMVTERYAIMEHPKWKSVLDQEQQVKEITVEEARRRCRGWRRLLGICWE